MKWQPTPVFLSGRSHGRRSLVRYSVWGYKESHKTEWLHFLFFLSHCLKASLVAQMVKNLPATWETRVWFLGREEEIATHSSILAWEIPWTEEPGRPWSHTVRHYWATRWPDLSTKSLLLLLLFLQMMKSFFFFFGQMMSFWLILLYWDGQS